MPHRVIQVFLEDRQEINLADLLKDYEVLGIWRDIQDEQQVIASLLVSADATEPILDHLTAVLADVYAYRVVLIPIEAVLPRPAADKEAEQDPTPEAEAAARRATRFGRVSREEIYADAADSLVINRVFVAMTVLSAVVAAVGLMRNDVAIIIGAMVIAPLLGPNVALALATTLGDAPFLRRAVFANFVGMMLALVLSIGVGLVFAIDPSVPAIAARTHISFGDIILGLAAGSAGTFALSAGLSGAVIGVMVAVALMPPLVTFGMLVGIGEFGAALGALALFASNVVCVNLAGVGTFLYQGVQPRTWWEGERARKATRIAVPIWFVLLALLLAVIYFIETGEV